MARMSKGWVLALRLAAVAVLSAACASVLGIETTKRTDRASSGYGNGYAGCQEGNCTACLTQQHRDQCRGEDGFGDGYSACKDGTCTACVSVDHECRCQGLELQGSVCVVPGLGGLQPADGGVSSCDDPMLSACGACVCNSCGDKVAACFANAACSTIYDCVIQQGCDPTLDAADTCYQVDQCKAVIDAAGGPDSFAYRAMLNVVTCAVASDCECSFQAPNTATTCEGGADCPNGEGGPAPITCQAPDCSGCATTGAECLCGGNSVDACLVAVIGGQCEAHFEADHDACGACSCGSCGSELLTCVDDPGCMNLARCINIHQCSGDACDTRETCGDLLGRSGGVSGATFQAATALAQCQATQDCPCTHQNDEEVVTCGTHQCEPFVEGDSDAGGDSLPACCFEQQGQSFCGLDATGVLYTGCEPRDLSGSPGGGCNGIQTRAGFPYEGAFLPGCCRPTTASSAQNGGPGVCGYNDIVTGLGCLPTEKVTGVTTAAQACNYVR
jgi:hypothetical protein